MFRTLTDEDLQPIVESGLEPKAYRFVNIALNIMLVSKIQYGLNKVSPLHDRKLNGFDLIQIMRYTGASFYGMLAPCVMRRWGIFNDSVVHGIVAFLFILNGVDTKNEILNRNCYTESHVLVPVENMDELESFDGFIQQLGSSFLE